MEILKSFSGEFYSGLANLLQVAGFLLSLAGLVYSFLAKRASEQARDAANFAKRKLSETTNFGDLESAIGILEEITRLLRQSAWEIALDRLTVVKKNLYLIKAGATEYSDEDQSSIQSAIVQVSRIMEQVEVSREKPKKRLEVAKINITLSNEIGKLSTVKTSIRNHLVR